MNLPPSCNTGVATPRPYTVVLDYLACHVESDVQYLVEVLCRELRLDAVLGRPMHGYTNCADLAHGADVWLRVYYSHGTSPFLQASGEAAQVVENVLRQYRLRYRTTRKDAALDLFDAEWFGVLVDVTTRYALSATPPRKVEYAGDWLHAKKGRTLYCGARTSRAFLRLYEKGRKERTDADWIRAEVEYKPQSEAEQYHASELTAAQVWTLRASHVWGQVIGYVEAEVVDSPVVERRRRDQDRSRNWLANQYGNCIDEWLAECDGDPCEFVGQLLQRIQAQKAGREIVAEPGAAIDSPELQP